MKILYIKLKNFATIYTAMHKKEIEIDFTKCKNCVVLFVGDNGSGKTSILSTLHPFAYSGNMDIRSTSSLIREDHDGYKEIHIKNNDNIYVIKHFYKNTKRGILVKSFIERDGIELNPNGNVTSFNETIKIELSLELDFLRLLRLGSNVTNLIDMKAVERKSFASELLSDINIYNELFKKVTDDNRVLRNLLKTVSDKITRLNIVDKDLLKIHMKDLDSELQMNVIKRDKIQKEIGQFEGKISLLLPEGISIAKEKLNELQTELSDITVKIIKNKKKLDDICLVLNGDIEYVRNQLIDLRTNYETDIAVKQNQILLWNEQISSLRDELEVLDSKLRLITSDVEYSQILRLHVELSEKVKKDSKKYEKYIQIYTKENLILLLNILNQMNDIALNIYGFDNRAIKRVISLIRDNKNIPTYVSNEINKIDREILKITSKFKNDSIKDPVILFKPSKCNYDDCPYLFLYDLLFSEKKDDAGTGLVALETEKDILTTMLDINTNIEYIFMIIKSNMPIISKGNIDYFKIDHILDCIEHGENIFNEDYITNMISEVEEYDDYIETKNKLKDISAELKAINNNKDSIDNITSEQTKINNKIIKYRKDIERLKEYISNINTHYILHIDDTLSDIEKYQEIKTTIDSDINKSILLESEINSYKLKLNSIQDNLIRIDELKKSLQDLDWSIDKTNKELFDTRFNIKQFDDLSKERETLNDKFEELNLIKESLSSSKGIPLLFIQLYLKNTKMYVNDLLNIVYSDDFQIDDFDVTPTEFNIPYIKNGIRISDVSFASQGEKSFLSLALSFALINQSIKNYNILLLDEIDSTLDVKNRAMFLNILEKQMESISAEQIFLITHNNMFDSYPVDVVLTSNNRLDAYSNANIIYSNS